MGKRIGLFILSLILCIVVVTGGAAYIGWQFVNAPASSEKREVIYEVLPGRSFAAVARDLQLLGVVQNAEFFSLFARALGLRPRMKAGEYLLHTSMRPKEVLDVITSGRSIARPFTVSEGLNIFEIAQAFEAGKFGTASEFLKLARDQKFAKSLLGIDADSVEGYLFPETYQMTKFTTARELITAMVARFNVVWKNLALPAGRLSKHELVILASIIEKETGAPEERSLISAVFHNRLNRRMRLQTDPTIIYGIADLTGRIPSNITKADITRPTRYNTYVINGLPPGPIANPGAESLRAAFYPQQSDALFFVSRNDGTHIFSSNYRDHEKAVRDYQKNPRARQGKSWRDLKR